MAADAWFTTGSSHLVEGTVCQDYALASGACAVVADGCSSSPMTDVGARLLAFGVLDNFAKNNDTEGEVAVRLVIPESLPPTALDASLLHARHHGGVWSVGLTGDGVIVARCPDGLHVSLVEWAGNMPGYMSYGLDNARKAAFLEQSEFFADIERRQSFRARGYHISQEGCIATWVDYRSAEAGLEGFKARIPADADCVALFSDGVCQVSGVPWHEAVATLMDFQGLLSGLFVKRRMRAVLKAWAKEGKVPVDDISMAAVSRDV